MNLRLSFFPRTWRRSVLRGGLNGTFKALSQADRCLRHWLREENRRLPRRLRRRAAALIARYFAREEGVSDQLIESFLRHYAGFREVDLDDPQAIRLEIKEILDRAPPQTDAPRLLTGLCAGLGLALILWGGWALPHKRLTPPQIAALRARVMHIAALDPQQSKARIWAQVKAPLAARRYQDIAWIDYPRARRHLDIWISKLEQAPKP